MAFEGLTAMRRVVMACGARTFEVYILTFGQKPQLLGCIPSEKIAVYSWVESAVLTDLRHELAERGIISKDTAAADGAIGDLSVVKSKDSPKDKDRLF